MADRYPNRPFPADDYGRGDQHGSGGESDPLAELARLIGQTDPFGSTGRANPAPPLPRAAAPRAAYQPQAPVEEDEPSALSGPPQWIQRANIQRQAGQAATRETPRELQRETRRELPPELPREVAHEIPYEEPEEEYPNAPSTVHPLHRYAAQQPAYQQPAAYQQPPAYPPQPPAYPPQAPAYQQEYREPAYDEGEEQTDPSRYDDALYGQLESGTQDFQREPAYPDDPYAYQDGYEEEPDERPKRRGGLLTVAAVLTLAVIGTGAAFAYRTYVGSARIGDPPIIKADNSPTKMVPAPSDSAGKTPDRMPAGDGTEKIVPREEAPVDVNARTAGPRVVFPPLNQNANPPSPASVATNTMPPAASGVTPSNGTMTNGEPRKIRTFAVHGDQPDGAAAPVTAAPAPPPASPKSAAATRQVPPPAATRSAAPAPTGNAPLSLSPDSAQASLPPAPAEPRTRMAATAPTATAPASDAAPAAEGRFLVQLSSQPSEAEAQSSFRSLQKKFPDQLGSQSPVIKRADLGEKGIRYRAMVGPFASRDEATRFCMSYKSAGGQCFVP